MSDPNTIGQIYGFGPCAVCGRALGPDEVWTRRADGSAVCSAACFAGKAAPAPDAIEELRYALAKYGCHKIGCFAYRSNINGKIRGGYKDLKDPRSYSEECTCGFDQAKKL